MALGKDGLANLRFAALARVPPGVPFFPAGYGQAGQEAFAVGLEAADLILAAVEQAATLAEARAAIVEQMTLQKQILERERDKVAQRLKTVESQLEKLANSEQAEIERRLEAAMEGRPKPVLPQRDGTRGSDQPKRDIDQPKHDSAP